jgi:hypothetical protein
VNPDQEPVGLVPRQHAGPRATEIAQLQEDFPGFRIWQETTGERTRLVAVRRQHGTGPHTVVTADLTELRAVLDSHRHTSSCS